MSVSLLIVVRDHNSQGLSMTSQVLKFEWRADAVKAMNELIDHYEGSSSMRIKVTLLEGTA